MRDERALRELKSAWSMARSSGGEAWEEAGRAWYWLARLPRMAFCWLTGVHRWGEWREDDLFFTPPESRSCRRCHVVEYRGEWPVVRVEAGSAVAFKSHPPETPGGSADVRL